MAGATPKSWYWTGFYEGVPFILVVMPFGFLFGVISTEAGLSPFQTLAFTSVVFAGASQFAALQLMVDQVPVVIVLATALAVNLRMAMYSASLSLWIGETSFLRRAFIAYLIVDQSYAVSINRFEDQPELTVPQRIAFFLGSVSPIVPMWMLACGLGIWFGTGIPDWLALDFAVPICFLAIIAPMMRTLAHVAAALTSITLALLLAFVPYNLGLLIAALIAMAVGAQVELMQKGRSHDG